MGADYSEYFLNVRTVLKRLHAQLLANSPEAKDTAMALLVETKLLVNSVQEESK